jgi:cytochrome c oxidase subunit III
MAGLSTAEKVVDRPAGKERRLPSFAGGGPPAPPERREEPVISNARLALLMFLAAEAMFFAGLIGAFLVFRIGSAVWPPPFQPRLPVGVTGVNTVILLASALTVQLALRAVRGGRLKRLTGWLMATAGLGGIFVGIQGYEWVRLVHFGLTVSSGVYGATFYTLVGFHAIHVLGALVWLLGIAVLAWRGRFTAGAHRGVELCAIYWTFVVGLWPVLYGLVYLY